MHDEWQILRIPIEGRVLVGKGIPAQLRAAIADLLGVDPTKLPSLFEGGGVQSQTVIRYCRIAPPRDEETQIAAIFSLILGCCLFTDKSGSRMRIDDIVFTD